MRNLTARTRSYLGKTALTAISFLVIGIAVEGLARSFLPGWAPRTAMLTSLWEHDTLLGWAHVPGAEGRFAALGFDTHVTINSRGFRDVEREYEKDPSTFRIVALGDSMVWGYGVEDGDAFTRLVEDHLQDVEMINMGVSGYGTDQELILLRNEGLRYGADLYVLVLGKNDFLSNGSSRMFMVYEKPFFVLGEEGDPELKNTPVPRTPWLLRQAVLLTRSSFVLNRTAQALNQLRAPQEPWPPNAESDAWRQPFPRNFREEITVKLIEEIQREVEAAGAVFVLVLIDTLGPIAPDVEEFFSGRARVVNLQPDFAGQNFGALHVDGVHWNAAGHSKVADRLIAYLRDQQLLPAPQGEQGR